MTPEILSYSEYMKRHYYGVMEDAVAPSNTTANIALPPTMVFPDIMARHKKRFTDILANVYDKHKTNNK